MKHHRFTYSSWRSIRNRTVNPSAAKRPDFHHYAGKGVAVCERWNDFWAFLEDMGERPSRAHSIDRFDSNKGYEPGNCRWATRPEQVADLPQNQKGYRRKPKPQPEVRT